jgi:hypothetical protein
VIIAAGVTERMRIDSGGNLGLGTSAPTVQFQINGTQPQIQWSNPTTGATSNDGTHLYLSGSDFWLVNKETAAMVFATDNTERMRIDASGNLGIGTTSYVGRLSVSLGNATSFGAPGSWDSTYALFGGTTGNAPAVAIGFNSTSGGIISSLAPNVAWRPMNYLGDSHLFMLYGSEAMRLNTAGNLGIGTSSPATRLHVASTGNTTVRIDSTNGQTPELSLFSNGVYDWRIRGGTSLSFTVDATERMRLDPSGNVGIGATLPGATGIAPFVAIGANNAGIGSASANNIAIVTDNTERMRINSAGNVGIGTSSPGTRLDVAGTITATGWSGGGIVTETATQTLTNKRIDPRAVPGGTSGTLTINGNTTDLYEAENLVGAITFAQPSGTPVDGQKLMIRIKDNGTARGITWTTSAGAFRAVGITLPTTTTANRVTYLGCVYNSTDGFWDVLAAATQA